MFLWFDEVIICLQTFGGRLLLREIQEILYMQTMTCSQGCLPTVTSRKHAWSCLCHSGVGSTPIFPFFTIVFYSRNKLIMDTDKLTHLCTTAEQYRSPSTREETMSFVAWRNCTRPLCFYSSTHHSVLICCAYQIWKGVRSFVNQRGSPRGVVTHNFHNFW